MVYFLAANILSGAGQDARNPRIPDIYELSAHVAGRGARLGWWREARFGMFVHWGVSSVLGGSWNGNWIDATAASSWPIRVTEKCEFDISVVYDASALANNDRLVEGDAGKELAKANSGAGGAYVMTISGSRFSKTVRTGRSVSEPLGRVILEPGRYLFRIAAVEVTGAELFRLRRLVLDPVRP
jgi:hypothetical protein